MPRTYRIEAQLLAQQQHGHASPGQPQPEDPLRVGQPDPGGGGDGAATGQPPLPDEADGSHEPLVPEPDLALPAEGPAGGPDLRPHRGREDPGHGGVPRVAADGEGGRPHRHHLPRMAGRSAGLPAGGLRPAELPGAAPLDRGVHHRRDHLHSRGARGEPQGGHRRRDGGRQATAGPHRRRRPALLASRSASRRRHDGGEQGRARRGQGDARRQEAGDQRAGGLPSPPADAISQTQLSQQRAIYADAHPAIVTLLQSISALQEPSPQLQALTKEERDLQAEYERLSARRAEGSAAVAKARSRDTSRSAPATSAPTT